MKASKSLDGAIIFAATVVTLIAVPAMLRFERTHADWSTETSAAVAAMSAGEREDLEANYNRLRKQLTEDKRNAVMAVHGAVTQDTGLAARLENYHEWLQELDVVERDSVRSADSVERKVATIQSLLAEAEERFNGFYVDADDWFIRRRGAEFAAELQIDLEMDGLRPLWITSREYDRMVDIFVKAFPQKVQSAFNETAGKIDPNEVESERFRLRAAAMRKAMFDFSMKTGDRSILSLSADTVENALNEIEDSEKREKLKALNAEQKEAIVHAIRIHGLNPFQGLERYFPNDRQAEEFFLSMDRKAQIKLMAVSTDTERGSLSQRQRLNLTYITENDQAPEDIRNLAESILKQSNRSHRSRGGGGRRGGRPRGGRPERQQRPSAPPNP